MNELVPQKVHITSSGGGVGIFTPPYLKESGKKPSNIDLDLYDQRSISRMLKSGAMQNSIHYVYESSFGQALKHNHLSGAYIRDPEVWPKAKQQFNTLFRDLYGIFYRNVPHFYEKDEIEEAAAEVRPLTEQILASGETEKQRVFTRLNEGSALIRAYYASLELLKAQAKEDGEEAVRNQEATSTSLGSGNGTTEGKGEAEQQAQQSASDGDGNRSDGDGNRSDSNRSDSNRSDGTDLTDSQVRSALRKGGKRSKNTEAQMASWGLNPGDLSTVTPDERVYALESIARNTKEFADLVGKFREMAAKRYKVSTIDHKESVSGIEFGNDITAILPMERIAYHHPQLRADWERRYLERKLLQYQMTSNHNAGYGPMVVNVDASGSMADTVLVGDKSYKSMDWAIAVTMGLLYIARKQKRPFVVQFFDSKIIDTISIVGNDKDYLAKMMRIATQGPQGGTDFEQPLLSSLKIIERQEKFRDADIVFITDGMCHIHESSIRRITRLKHKLKTEILAVSIVDQVYSKAFGKAFDGWCDRLITIGELAEGGGDAEVTNLYDSLIKKREAQVQAGTASDSAPEPLEDEDFWTCKKCRTKYYGRKKVCNDCGDEIEANRQRDVSDINEWVKKW